MSAVGVDVDDRVRVETPRGESTVATVVDREPAGTVSGPDPVLTVGLDDVTWRVTESDVELLE